VSRPRPEPLRPKSVPHVPKAIIVCPQAVSSSKRQSYRIETVVQIDHHMAFNGSFETEAKVVGSDPDSPESVAKAI